MKNIMTIGIINFRIPPVYNRVFTGDESAGNVKELCENRGYRVIETDIATAEDLRKGIATLMAGNIGCIIVYLRHWTRISLIARLVRTLNMPTALYCRTTGGYNGVTALTAASAVLREMSGGEHVRFKEGMEDDLLKWIASVNAYTEMKRGSLLCWGGHYGADMPYTRSDSDFLESRLIGEVMTEQESLLTARADSIIAGQPERVAAVLKNLAGFGMKFERDGKMVTDGSLSRQAALYLAARDRLAELKDENILGVSIKCHFELSTTIYGCTGCFLPAFLPFPIGLDGDNRPAMPVACEGDLNGLISLVMLHVLNRDVPPLFGDFVEYNNDFILMRNCGASSVYWAGLSNSPEESFPQAALRPNMHGASGASLHYETPAADSVTACRLFRLDGKFILALGVGRILAEADTRSYSDTWPHTRLDFGVDADLLFKTYPCNHGALTLGDWTFPLEHFCRLAGIGVLRIDSASQMQEFERNLR